MKHWTDVPCRAVATLFNTPIGCINLLELTAKADGVTFRGYISRDFGKVEFEVVLKDIDLRRLAAEGASS